MAVDEFAKAIGKRQRQDTMDRGYIQFLTCTSTSPISVKGADEDIPLAVSKGISTSTLTVGSTMIVARMGNKMVLLGYL